MYIKIYTTMNKTLLIRLPEKMLKDYKSICEVNGFSMSKRLRMFISTEIKENGKETNK